MSENLFTAEGMGGAAIYLRVKQYTQKIIDEKGKVIPLDVEPVYEITVIDAYGRSATITLYKAEFEKLARWANEKVRG